MKKIYLVLLMVLMVNILSLNRVSASVVTVIDVQFNTIDLNTPVLISGTDKHQGAIYRYSNAIVTDTQSVDAILILEEINGINFSSGGVDSSSSFYVWAKLGNSNNSDGSINYKFEFIAAGSSYDSNNTANNQYVGVKNFSLTGMDLDGDGTTNEYFEINGYSELIVNDPTNLIVTENQQLGLTRITGSEVDTNGSTAIEKPENAFIAKYSIPVSSINIVMGMTNSSNTRYFYINLGTEIPSGTNAGQPFEFDTEQVTQNTVAPYIDTLIDKDSNDIVSLDNASNVAISGLAYNLLNDERDNGSLTGQTVNLEITDGTHVINATAIVASDDTYSTNVDLSSFSLGEFSVSATIYYNGNPASANDTATISGSYVITWNLDGDETSDSYQPGDTIVKSDPIKDGYTFDGWYSDETLLIEYVLDTMPSNNLTLYAKWTINTYTITFESNGGTPTASITQAYGTAITAPEDPTREGYTFNGWDIAIPETMPAEDLTITPSYSINQYTFSFDTQGGNVIDDITTYYSLPITAPEDPTREGYTFNGWDIDIPANMPAEDMTFTAAWTINTYTITFESNGGTPTASIEQNYGTEITAPEDPTREGYTFNGWDIAIPQTMPAEDLTITPSYSINTYTISFDTQGGTVIDHQSVTYDVLITLPIEPTKEGYTFGGWYLDDQRQQLYQETTMPAEDFTLYARWLTNAYTITFDTQGGTSVTNITDEYGREVTIPDSPTKEGYTFNGWDIAIPQTMPAEDLMITAQWSINAYTITFNTNGGTSVTSIEQNYGTAITAPEDPTREGYTFNGWDITIPETMPAEDMMLSATWTPIQYSITFNTNGGSSTSNVTQNYGSEVTLPEDPTKEGYTFDGWYQDPELQDPFTSESSLSSNMTLYAKWVANIYTIQFTNYDGSIIQTENYIFGQDTSDLLFPLIPQRDGYEFIGWDTTVPSTMPSTNLVLNAMYLDIEAPTISFSDINVEDIIYHQVNTDFIVPECTTSDNHDIEVTCDVTSNVNTHLLGTYYVTYVSTDEAGNVSPEIILTIVVEDTIAPEVVVLSENITIKHGESISKAISEILSVTDNYDREFEIISDDVSVFEPGNYTLTISVLDSSGNQAIVNVDITVEPIWIYYMINASWLVVGTILVVMIKKRKRNE